MIMNKDKTKCLQSVDFRRKRLSRGLTQFEVARRSRLHPATISRIEAGRYRPYPTEARRLARALGIRI